MTELVNEYLERFNESFPLFMVMDMEDEQIETLIRDCLEKGVPYRPDDTNPDILY